VHASGGGNYQSLINEALRQHIARSEIEAAIARRRRGAGTFPVEHYTGKRIREFDRAEADLGKALRRPSASLSLEISISRFGISRN